MAKLALINRELKRAALVKKYAGKRAELKAIIDDQSKTEEERFEARLKLQSLRFDRKAARHVSQVRLGSHQAKRIRYEWRNSWNHQS